MKRHIPKILRVIASFAVFALFLIPFTAGMIKLKPIYKYLRYSQFGPDVIALAGSFTYGLAAIVLGMMIFAFIFGRFYCAFMCPFGILQDVIRFLSFRKKPVKSSNHKVLRYAILFVALGLLAGGWSVFFRILDPYSFFGSISSNTVYPAYAATMETIDPNHAVQGSYELRQIVWGGIIPLILLIIIVIWRGRIYCTSICPVGTIFGLCAKKGIFQMKLNKTCVSCGLCAKVCPAGCIDTATKSIDNERCLRCMNCVSACRKNAVSFGIGKPDTEKTVATADNAKSDSISRRAFIIGAGATAFGAGALTGLYAKPSFDDDDVDAISSTRKIPVVPPGAGTIGRFVSRCTSCRLCVVNCTGKVIRNPDSKIPFVHLDFSKGMCEYECHRCSTVCTTGALEILQLKKKKLKRIGLADFKSELCIAVIANTVCGACAEHCPTGALRMEAPPHDPDGVPIPVLNESLCIGCGSCEFACPEKAILVNGVTAQIDVESPEDYFRRNPPVQEPVDETSSGEWLL